MEGCCGNWSATSVMNWFSRAMRLNNDAPEPEDGLSTRGRKAVPPPISYYEAYMKCQQDLWSDKNPNGYIPLAVAENRLSTDLVIEKLPKCVNIDEATLGYGDFRGIPRLRNAMANMLMHTFMDGVAVDPGDLAFSSGAGSHIDLLSWCLANPGDGVLIPSPCYPAFDNDLTIRSELAPIHVPALLDDGFIPSAEALELAVMDAQRRGIKVRILLLTNPSNPLGIVFPREGMKRMVLWALRQGLHVVCDEIYALSVYGPGPEFVSVAKVVQDLVAQGMVGQQVAEQKVHIVYGFSKDFCMNGLRIGVVWSRNKALLKAYGNLLYFSGVSQFMQMAVASLIEDLDWVDRFTKENCRRLKEGYDALTAGLDKAQIRYLPAHAAIFLWIDLRDALPPNPTWADEQQLWEEIFETQRLLLSPGKSCHAGAPGFYRACWAWMHASALRLVGEKLACVVQARRFRSYGELPPLENDIGSPLTFPQ